MGMIKAFACFAAVFLIGVAFYATSVFAGVHWGLHFPKDGERPTGPATAAHLQQFDAYFIGDENDKVLYLTFDAGYEIDLTPGILDVLKKQEVPAAFFLVGNYIRDNPELIRRMVAEGHSVANHTMTHPDMSKINSKEAFERELSQVETYYKQIIGSEMPRYYRPPKGIYSESNLKHAQELGYKTVFWSCAYKDWDEKNQPTKEAAFDKLIPRVHPGAVVLLHNTSKTNALILDELLTKYKTMGYRFESLDHLTK